MPVKKPKHPLVKEVHYVRDQVHKLGDEVGTLFSKIRQTYSSLDETTKQHVAAGIAGLGVVLAATVHYRKKMKEKSSKK